MISTTDDPLSPLEYHRLLKEEGFDLAVLPSFRPDPALNIHKAGFREYIKALSLVSKMKIETAEDVANALISRIAFFDSMGCRAADHGLDYIIYEEKPLYEINKTFTKALSGDKITVKEAEAYQTYILKLCAKEYKKLGWEIGLKTANTLPILKPSALL